MKMKTNAAFTHAGLTTRYPKKILHKSIYVVKVTRYIVYEEDRKLGLNYKHEKLEF